MSGRSGALEIAAVMLLVAGRADAGLLGTNFSGGAIGAVVTRSAFGTPDYFTLPRRGSAAVNVAGTFRAPKRRPELSGSGKDGALAGRATSAPTV